MTRFKRLLTPLMVTAALLAGSAGAFAQIREHTLRLGVTDPKAAPGPAATRHMADLVKKASGGKIKIRVYDSAVLGNEVQMQGALQGGVLDLALMGAPTLSGLVKEFGVLDLPYSFRSPQQADAVLDGPAGRQLLAKLRDKNIVGLDFWEIGFRQITNSRRPITRWEDVGGLKIRTVQSAVFREFFNSLGANAVPMAINEVYTALETGAIDAQENPPTLIAAQKFDEVQKHLSLTNHIYTAYALVASPKTWDALNEDERKLITEAAHQARAFQRDLVRKQNAALLVELRKKMSVNELAPAELARFADKAQPLRAKFAPVIGEEFMQQWQAALDAARGAEGK